MEKLVFYVMSEDLLDVFRTFCERSVYVLRPEVDASRSHIIFSFFCYGFLEIQIFRRFFFFSKQSTLSPLPAEN